jgi:hypothetical protein
VENSTEVPFTRSLEPWKVVNSQYLRRPEPEVDALSEADLWLGRTDLAIEVPIDQRSGSNITSISVSQSAVDSISYYLNQTYPSLGLVGARNDSATADKFYPTLMQIIWDSDDLESRWSNLAASISNSMRGNADGGREETGQVLPYETFI